MVECASRVRTGSGNLGDLLRRTNRSGFVAGITQFEHGDFKTAGGENGGAFRKCAAIRRGFYFLQKVKLL
jgi:hypothetical protein